MGGMPHWHTGAGEEREKEGAAEKKCYALTATPTPHPPVLLRGEEIEMLGLKLSLGKWWRVQGEGGFGFTSHCPSLLLIGNKSNYFPQINYVLPKTVNGK